MAAPRIGGLWPHAGGPPAHGEPGRTTAAQSEPSIFDVASLTKVVTAVLCLRRLDPDDRLEWLAVRPTVADLLAHRSGLPAWRPLFALAAREIGSDLGHLPLPSTARAVMRRVIATDPGGAPVPTYSDLGFLALGFDLEDRSGETLAALARREVFDPLGLCNTAWGLENSDAAPTGRGRPRPGNPWLDAVLVEGIAAPEAEDDLADDDNAAALGGVAGHAGLWSTAEDMVRLGDHLRGACEGEPSPVLSAERAKLLFTDVAGTRTVGLDTRSPEGSSLGTIMGLGPRGAAGHLGFTGCSLWMDRDAELSVALLTNAVVYERPSTRIRTFRPWFHDEVARCCGG